MECTKTETKHQSDRIEKSRQILAQGRHGYVTDATQEKLNPSTYYFYMQSLPLQYNPTFFVVVTDPLLDRIPRAGKKEQNYKHAILGHRIALPVMHSCKALSIPRAIA